MSVLQSLRFIFWGVLVAAVTVLVNRFDLLNDVLGYAVIAIGMIGLLKNSAASRQGLLMKLITVAALLNAFWAPFAECPGRMPLLEKIAGIVLGILNAFAIVGFCIVMRRLCEKIPLKYAEKSWRTSLFLWRLGLPASLVATCLSWWSTKNEQGMISLDKTPVVVSTPLLVLWLIAIGVSIHSFVSLGRTIGGLKGLVQQLPAASDFGLEQQPSFRLQFSIRALMIVTAATAVVAAGCSQATIPYWQFTMMGLVGLSLAATWLDHRTLGKALLVVVAIVLFGGYMQMAHRGTSGSIGGFVVRTADSSPSRLSSEPALADIETWLAVRGFKRADPPPDPIGLLSSAGLHFNKPKIKIWYTGKTPQSQQIYLSVECLQIDQHLRQLQVDYIWLLDDFPWVVQEHERQIQRFSHEMAEWLEKHDEELQKKQPKP